MIIGQDYANALTDVPTQMLIAPVLPTMVSDRAYAVGEQFIVDNVLYKITQAVLAAGVALVIDSNCEVSNSITQQIKNQFIAPNYSNIVKEFSSSEITVPGSYEYITNPYEVTQDCFLIGALTYVKEMTTIGSVIRINNVAVSMLYGRLNTTPTYIDIQQIGVCIPIKKGQSLSIRCAANRIASDLKLYGVLT